MRNREYEQTYHGPMEIITLPGLDMEHEIPSGVRLKDLGEVSSLKRSFTEEVLRLRGIIGGTRTLLDRVLGGVLDKFAIFGGEQSIQDICPDIDTLLGCCLSEKISPTTYAHMLAVRKGLPENKRRFAEAHEASEYLQKTKKGMDELQAELDRRGIRLNCTSPSYRGEPFADIGGLLALRKAADSGVTGLTVPDFVNPRPWLKELQGDFGF
jgi:hypothetical protein